MANFWSAKTPIDAAKAALQRFSLEEGRMSSKRQMALRYGSAYENVELSSFGPYGYAVDTSEPAHFLDTKVVIIRNSIHSTVDTFVSKIGALATPKPALLTTEGSWKDRRQAGDIERLLEAEYLAPKAGYSTLNELWIQALRIAAAATGTVAVKYYAEGSKVQARIYDTLDMILSEDGKTVYCKSWYDADDLIEMFGEDYADIINEAKQPPPEEYKNYCSEDMVCLYEAWRGASSNKKGVYIAFLNAEDEPLKYEDYLHELPPFVKLNVDSNLHGPYAFPLTHYAYESCYRDNALLGQIDKAVSKINKSTTYVNKEALAENSAMDTQSGDREVVYVQDVTQAPKTDSAPGFHPAHLQLANMHKADSHSVPGVSEMHSAGRHEEGVDSAIGQRFIAALINERFAAVQRRYVQAVAVDSAKVIIQVLCDIYQENKKFTVNWPGQDSLREISAAVALKGIEALKYTIQPAAVNGSRNSPADRQQQAFELFKSQILSKDAYAGLQQNGYDLPEELDKIDSQREWWDKQIDKWMYAPDSKIVDDDFYNPPIRHMNVMTGFIRVIDGFLNAQMSMLEDERLEFFLMALADLDSMLADEASTPTQLLPNAAQSPVPQPAQLQAPNVPQLPA